jgi:hypothetical protein
MIEPLPDWDSPFTVVQDEEHHACVSGLPLPPLDITTLEGERAQRDVEYVAVELAKRFQLIWTKPK